MDTRTGYIYEGTPEEIARQIYPSDAHSRTLEQIEADLVALKSESLKTCPKCHGTGAVPRGLNSKRFKPCECVS